jgi:hypothetical protein
MSILLTSENIADLDPETDADLLHFLDVLQRAFEAGQKGIGPEILEPLIQEAIGALAGRVETPVPATTETEPRIES